MEGVVIKCTGFKIEVTGKKRFTCDLQKKSHDVGLMLNSYFSSFVNREKLLAPKSGDDVMLDAMHDVS